MIAPSQYLDYGALGLAMFTLLVAVGVLYRTLRFVGDMLTLILNRIQDNTAALVRLSERLHGSDERGGA